MRKVQFYGAISIDGCLATKDNRLDWLFKTAGANDAPTEAFMQQVDTAIMGRHTYEYTMEQTTDQLINPYNPATHNIVMTSHPTPAMNAHSSPTRPSRKSSKTCAVPLAKIFGLWAVLAS